MIKIDNKTKCSGCRACANICTQNAISFPVDEEGFWYPYVDLQKCVDCGLCELACPFHDPDHGVPAANMSHDTHFFAARLREEEELMNVSSGGAFQAFGRAVVNRGGIVYGAVQDRVDRIYHIRADSIEELNRTRRSKYLQSDVGDCYALAKKDLLAGKIVLFSGTGCQIAGLNRFLGKPYDKLYTCEVVCHGVPSQKVWDCYRQEEENRHGKRIVDLVFRDKSDGWSNNRYKITFEDGSTICEPSARQAFHAGYLQGFFYRPSCGSCPFASMPRTADVTLADYWKYKGPFTEGNRGISLVAVNNPHGIDLINWSDKLLEVEFASEEDALASCRHMDEHPIENPLRSAFLHKVFADGYFSAAREYQVTDRPSLKRRIKRKLKSLIGR